MPSKFKTFWYRQSAFAKNAFLFNCRDNDLETRPRANIEKGEIVLGAVGLVAAEEIVPGLVGKLISFRPDRRCEWQGHELRCMVHPTAPSGTTAKSALRDFNYAVAELPNSDVVRVAAKLGVPIVHDAEGRNLINVELASFQRQGKANPRRAKPI